MKIIGQPEKPADFKWGDSVDVYCIHSLYNRLSGEEKCYKECLFVSDDASLINTYSSDDNIDHCKEYFKFEQDADRYLKEVRDRMFNNGLVRRNSKRR